MPTDVRPRRVEAAHGFAPAWLLLALLLFYAACFAMMAEGLVVTADAVLLAAP